MWVEKLPSGRFRGGYIDALGRKRQKGGFVHRSAAKTWAEDGEEAALRGDLRDPMAGRTDFAGWANRWWAARVVEVSTAANEKARFDEVVEKWGDWPIASIGSLEVQAWVKEMSQTRSAGTVRKYHGMLSVILTAAMRPPARLIVENPCRHVTLPPVPKGREVFLTREQVDSLDEELAEPWATLAVTLAYTGMRWGEAIGLHVERVDWLRRRVHVLDVIGQGTGGFHLKPYPKGRKGRFVPLEDVLLERLSEHVKSFPPQPCGLHDDCSGLIFSSRPRGREAQPVSRQTFNRHLFSPAALRAKLPTSVRPHDLRHTYASWLVQDGVSLRRVQYLLGHASITTTERYAHLAPDAADDDVRMALGRGNIRGNEEAIQPH